jgi:hypothetical protein
MSKHRQTPPDMTPFERALLAAARCDVEAAADRKRRLAAIRARTAERQSRRQRLLVSLLAAATALAVCAGLVAITYLRTACAVGAVATEEAKFAVRAVEAKERGLWSMPPSEHVGLDAFISPEASGREARAADKKAEQRGREEAEERGQAALSQNPCAPWLAPVARSVASLVALGLACLLLTSRIHQLRRLFSGPHEWPPFWV